MRAFALLSIVNAKRSLKNEVYYCCNDYVVEQGKKKIDHSACQFSSTSILYELMTYYKGRNLFNKDAHNFNELVGDSGRCQEPAENEPTIR